MLKCNDIIKITYAKGVRFAVVKGFFNDHRNNTKLRVKMLDNGEIRHYHQWDERIITNLDPVEIVRWRLAKKQKDNP